MKIKKYVIKVVFLFLFFCLIFNNFLTISQASTNPSINTTTVIEGMTNVGDVTASGKIFSGINMVIRLIQLAGSGISIVMVTMLGVKYMLASAGEKADIKKQAVPIIVGCVLLFAAVNLVAIVADVGAGLSKETSAS